MISGGTMRAISGMLILVFATLFVGCSILPEDEPAPSVHMLEWRGGAVSGDERSGSLQIAMPVAYPGYDSSYIRYRQGGGSELHRYARNRWVDRPAVLVGAALTEAVADRGPYERVGPPGNPIPAGYRLESDLVRLEQVFGDGDSRVHLTLRYRLVEVASGDILGSVRHQLEGPVPANPEGAVRVANELLNDSLQRLADALPAWRSPD